MDTRKPRKPMGDRKLDDRELEQVVGGVTLPTQGLPSSSPSLMAYSPLKKPTAHK